MKYFNTNKLEELNINKENVCIILDFDKTITTGDSSDSWDASGKKLGKKYSNEAQNFFNFYAPIEGNYDISIKQKEAYMKEWYEKCIDLFYKYDLTINKLNDSIKISNLLLRGEIKEFFNKAYKNNIPVIIISAGIGNVIEQFLRNKECYFDNIHIISNFIEFDESR